MENPRLSFITPTVVAGDKSLVNLIAHELAHSWSGNLVTNESWRDLWLNEGFTSYVENRIMEAVFGKERAIMEQALDTQGLKAQIKALPPKDTILYIDLAGRDPDDAFSSIPYTKGQLFLIYLEQQFGREKFDAFLLQYFNDHAFQSIGTTGFVKYIKENLTHKYKGVVSDKKLNEWIYGEGLPKDAPNPTSDAFVKVDEQSQQWVAGKTAQVNTQNWTVHEWLHFINNLPRDLPKEKMVSLDKAYNLTNSTNAEIAHAWYKLALSNGYEEVKPALEKYLVGIGRRKLIVPLYKMLAESGNKAWAKQVYAKARPGYHPLAQGTVDAIFQTK